MYNEAKPLSNTLKKLKVKINLKKCGLDINRVTNSKGDVEALTVKIPVGCLYQNEFGEPLLYLNAFRLKQNTGWVIKQQVPSDKYKAMNDEEKKAIPLIGDITEVIVLNDEK